MKNLKKKLKTSLAGLACVLMLGSTVNVANAGLFEGKETKKDPDVMKVLKILKEYSIHTYRISDNKTISFSYEGVEQDGYLTLFISKNHGYAGRITIQDYKFDNLDDQDIVIFGRYLTDSLGHGHYNSDRAKFGDLSNELKEKIRKEYNLRIKEAPEKLLEERKRLQEENKRIQEKRMKELETNISDVLD